MSLILVGVNHRTASVTLRERLAIPSRELPQRLANDRAALDVDEIAILSTCNRTEWYVHSDDPTATTQQLFDRLSVHSGLSTGLLERICYCLTEEQAVTHLFRVAAGLDSMILGESEITAQVKHAYAAAQHAGSAGPLLHRVFQKALHCAKLVRSRTRIADGCTSVGSVVTKLARELFGDQLSACEVLLWGAGKAAETTTKHLVAGGIGKLWIVNRTQDKAQQLAELCQGGWISWERARQHLSTVDIAIVCTQAPHYVIDQHDLAAILPQRAGRRLCLIDLALPRNIDPAVAGQSGVCLYNIDDLEATAYDGLRERREQRQECGTLIAEQVSHVVRWPDSSIGKEVVVCRA